MRPNYAFLQQFLPGDNKYVRVLATDPVQRAKLAVDQSSVRAFYQCKEPEYKGSAILVIHHHAVMVCKAVRGLCLLGQLALFGTVIWHTCGLTNVELALVGVGLVVFSAIVSLVNNLCCLCGLVWSVGAPAYRRLPALFSTLLLGLTWGYDKVVVVRWMCDCGPGDAALGALGPAGVVQAFEEEE